MKMQWLTALAIVTLSLPCLAAEKSALTKTSDNIQYVNDYFNLRITKPSNWYSQSPENNLRLTQQATKMVSGDDKNMEAILKASLETSTFLFAFYKYAPGTPVKTNPNISGVAENVSHLPGIKKGCDYLFHVKRLMKNAAMQFDISDSCETHQINGATMGQIKLTTKLNGLLVKQVYSSCIAGDHAISVVQTFFDKTDKTQVDEVLNSLQIACH